MSEVSPPSFSRLLWTGLLISLALGCLLGYLRYWLGFFVIVQGALLGLGVPWLVVTVLGGEKPRHPGFKVALLVAFLWFIGANVGLMLGFGLAQPWFEPVGWLSRILRDDTAEFVFGVASTGGFARGVAMGAQGGFWLLLCAIDWSIMFFFIWIMPWGQGQTARKKVAEASS